MLIGSSITAAAAGQKSRVVTYREILRDVMRDALQEHPHTVILGQGARDHKGIFGTTLGLAEEFGDDRVVDTPLMEEGLTGIAIGAALNGLYPIMTHIRADFVLLAMNQLINLAAKYKYMSGGRFEVPMLIRMVIGRSWGQGAQHSQSLQSLFAHLPGLVVLMPATAQAIVDSYPFVIAQHRGPVLAIEHRLLYELEFRVVDGPREAPPFGARNIRSGKDATIVATSIMVLEALRAAEHVSREWGIECDVIDLNCVSHVPAPVILGSVQRTGRLLVADTSWRAYGVCAEVCRIVCEHAPSALRAPVATLGMEPAPCPTAKTLEDLFYPNVRDVADAIGRLVTGRADHGLLLPDVQSATDVYKRFKGPF